jgi:hypothetical protein
LIKKSSTMVDNLVKCLLTKAKRTKMTTIPNLSKMINVKFPPLPHICLALGKINTKLQDLYKSYDKSKKKLHLLISLDGIFSQGV